MVEIFYAYMENAMVCQIAPGSNPRTESRADARHPILLLRGRDLFGSWTFQQVAEQKDK